MTKKLKCPFCQRSLRTVLDSPFYTCDSCGYTGYEQLWTVLAQTKQDLENAKIALKEIRQKGLDNTATQFAMGFIADQALYKMEHKEQKHEKRNSAK